MSQLQNLVAAALISSHCPTQALILTWRMTHSHNDLSWASNLDYRRAVVQVIDREIMGSVLPAMVGQVKL